MPLALHLQPDRIKRLPQQRSPIDRVKSVAFSTDGREVASAGDDRNIYLWNVSRRRLIASIGTRTAPVISVAFSPDGKKLVAGGHDNSVRIFTRHCTLWGYALD